MKKHVMLDLETLGLKPGCPIISIGAVQFNTGDDWYFSKFYRAIKHEAQHFMDAPDEATMTWWGNQSEEARAAVFNNPEAIYLDVALYQFTSWIREVIIPHPDDELVIWGNGATFDEPIIHEALKRYSFPVPWTFRNSMCFRTLKELGKLCGVEEPVFEGTKHNALADALHQAKWADKVLRRMA